MTDKAELKKNQQAAILKWLKIIIEPGQITELRAFDVQKPGSNYRYSVISGYYDDLEKLASDAADLSGRSTGIYFLPNPVNPVLLARSNNKYRDARGKPTTSDADITSRRWLLIDVDPVRPSDISSSKEEHEAALDRTKHIKESLDILEWPLPIMADSGNGGHLLYRIGLPQADEGFIERVLKGLALAFDDDKVKVDIKVFNPARIWKVYGTLCAKGDHTKDRPHRYSKILETPEELLPVSRGQLQAIELVEE